MIDYETFMTIVGEEAELGWDAAERAARAVLETLGERIAQGEARDLAGQLPPELSPWIATTTSAEGFDVDEFVRRVAEREGVDVASAERHARAVFTALSRAVDRREYEQMSAELSKDYSALLAIGPQIDVVAAEVFLQRVAERTGLDPEDARRATDAVLETLAERIAAGEVKDLIARLPVALHEPLRRGAARSDGKATRIGLDAFLRRVAEREGIDDLEEARDHTRAVIRTLREAIGDREFVDVTDELPREYETVLAR
jgi:uncharacterized protein (DUF2267 family)